MLDLVKLLEQTISIPSVSGDEAKVAQYLVSQMRTFAGEAFVDDAGNAVARVGRGPLKVTFLGHIDTVPGDIPVEIKEGKLYGRGSVDAKGPFCTAVAAASLLGEEVLEKLTLTLIGAVEEEVASSKGARFALQNYPKPDLLIIGEPSGWDAVTLGYKGRLVLKLRVEKENFHSAGEGTTAAEDWVACWQRVRAWADEFNADTRGVFNQVQVALQNINSESDGLRQRAQGVVGLRLPPALPPQEARARLAHLLTDSNIKVTFVGSETPYRSPKDTPLTRAFRTAIRAQEGKPRLKLKTGTSDMNVVAPHWDVPMLAYGPGDSALDHTPYEHLSLEEYERAIGVLGGALESLAASHAE